MGGLALQIKLCKLKVSRLGDFEVSRRAEHDSYLSASAFDEAGFVGTDEFVGGRFRECPLKQMAAEALRRLRLHDVFAGNGGGNDGSVGGALNLLDGVYGGQADDGGGVLLDGANGALDGGRVDQGTDGVVNQNDVVRVAFNGVKRIGDALLAVIATLHDVNLAGESVIANLSGDAIHLARAHRNIHGGDLGHVRKCTQRMDENRNASQLEKLLRRR